jgi:alanine racemase
MILEIDRRAVVENYRHLGQIAAGSRVAAVVKANSYGLGMEVLAKTLYEAGCRLFYVAHLDEALNLRPQVPDAEIRALHGPMDAADAQAMLAAKITPVINHAGQLEHLATAWHQRGAEPLASSLWHVDSGMNRLGIPLVDLPEMLAYTTPGLHPTMIMSHLACADEPGHPLNQQQLDVMKGIRAEHPGLGISFANSAGIFLGSDWHFQEVRPGAALYGIHLTERMQPAIRPVARLMAPFVQFRTACKGENVGYGGGTILRKNTRLAVAAIGYADGLFRTLGDRQSILHATDGEQRWPCPIIGRVSMDLVTVDAGAVPETILGKTWLEIIGPEHPVEKIAAEAGTLGYEFFTRLGNRVERRYV